MNIESVEAKFARAREERKAGNHLEAARWYLTAQTLARKGRGQRMMDIEAYAHAGASIQASIVAENEKEDAIKRLEADEIRKLSCNMFMGKA